jgi:hypothetical protein
MLNHIPHPISDHMPVRKSPPPVGTFETAMIPALEDRLQWQGCGLLEHRDVRATRGSPGFLIDVEDEIGGDVLGVRRAIVGEPSDPLLVHRLDVFLTRSARLGTFDGDNRVREQFTHAHEISGVEPFRVHPDEILNLDV